MQRLGEKPKGESPLLAIRVQASTLALLKGFAKHKGITVSEYARQCLECCMKDESRREAARRLQRRGK